MGRVLKLKSVSEQLVEESGGMLSIFPEISDPSGRYLMHNDGGVEVEIGQLLYGLVKATKPAFVLETGTHVGVGASYLGTACRENNYGEVVTIEFIQENYQAACKLFTQLNLNYVVTALFMDVAAYSPDKPIDILFLDTEPQTRFAELLKFYPHVKEGGFILIHDLHPHMHQIPNEEHSFAWPYGPIPEQMRQLVLRDELRPVHFRNPRGLTLFYKTAVEDYKWS